MNKEMHDTPPPPAAIPDAMAEAIAAYALEALPPDEEAKVVAYLAAHADARAMFEEYRAIVGLLPYATVPSAPPPFVRDGVLRSIRGERTRRRFRFMPAWPRFRFAPAIAACLLLGLLLWNVGLQMRVGHTAPTPLADTAPFFGTPGLISYEMLPQPAAPGSSGRIYLSPDRKQTAFAVANLPALPPDRTYQLWFRLNDQTRVSIATFGVDASGAAVMVLPVPADGRAYISCGITQEPRGGSPNPTGPRILSSLEWPQPERYN